MFVGYEGKWDVKATVEDVFLDSFKHLGMYHIYSARLHCCLGCSQKSGGHVCFLENILYQRELMAAVSERISKTELFEHFAKKAADASLAVNDVILFLSKDPLVKIQLNDDFADKAALRFFSTQYNSVKEGRRACDLCFK